MPTEVFSDKCSLLVNMTRPVLDHLSLKIHYTDPLLQVLGVKSSPEPRTVIRQLQEASKQSQSTDISMLHNIANECYKFLDQWVSDSGNSTFISQCARSFPFIFVGNTFVNVNRVAESEQLKAKPYLHVLPPAFTIYRSLWKSAGVTKKFTVLQFRSVLQELHTQHGSKPLPQTDLSICLTILNNGIYEAKEETTGDWLIPNEQGVLQPATELFYNDSPWIPVTKDITLCHKNIPRPMAHHFGIKTTRHHTLDNCVSDNISPFSFEFEQKEQLSVRIKNIISAYPSKKDILKELIQNADDAEATEIHFVWDKREHGKEKTFGEKWNPLQGPALCVFNNKVFSDADLNGIQQLGEGGKHNSPGKIGKYGVGFNSVYHLTDCPSILTGDQILCISDPNQKYIESHSDKPPAGIGYNLDDRFKATYIDVYKSFLPDIFSLKEGTMFRLPLRMGTSANCSKISKEGVTDRDMKELCSALSEDPEGLILFLKNICKIKVHEIDEQSGKLKIIYEVEKSLPQESKEEKDGFIKCLQNAVQSGMTVTPKKTFYEVMISTSDETQSKWIVAEQFGSDDDVQKLSNKLRKQH
ncbi:sacsin-like [Mugil cephalus]|uniref:sacsin-like n=1 Tax=Mugil cephalus TaxID=48193 RepID=UPI001FB5A00B|nr:sacsin-like [Mugil cephalus]